mgnify:CR=1 FL=1
MPKNQIILITASVFICFGILLSIGIGMEAQDEANDVRWELSDLESRVGDVEHRNRRY